MDLFVAATNGSHHHRDVGVGEGAGGVGGSMGNTQEHHGRVESSQFKIAAAHSAQMGEFVVAF